MKAKEIIKVLELHKKELNRLSVKKIGVFGSVVKQKSTKKSDIDFLVVFNKSTFDNYMELKFLLERLFKKKIDLVTEKSLKQQLKYVKEEAIYAEAI